MQQQQPFFTSIKGDSSQDKHGTRYQQFSDADRAVEDSRGHAFPSLK